MLNQSDDGDRLTPEQRQFVEANYPLARKYAKDHAIHKPYFDDFVSEAVMGLIYAAKRWNPAEGTFSTYATYWMRHFTADMLRNLGQIRVPQYLHASKEVRDSSNYRFQDQADKIKTSVFVSKDAGHGESEIVNDLVTESPSFHEYNHVDFKIDVNEILRFIPDRHCEILHRRMRGDKLSTIAEAAGMTRERVRQLQDEAIEKIKDHLKIA